MLWKSLLLFLFFVQTQTLALANVPPPKVCKATLTQEEFERLASTKPLFSSLFLTYKPTQKCQKYQSFDGQSKGLEALKKDLLQAFNQGLQCMLSLGKKSQRINQYAKNLFEILSTNNPNPLQITCQSGESSLWEQWFGDVLPTETMARAVLCHHQYFSPPQIILNLDNLAERDEKDNQATFFHELVHHLNLPHPDDSKHFDLVYALEECCFYGKQEQCQRAMDLPHDSQLP